MSEPIINSWIGSLSFISEPFLYFWVGILLTVLIVFGARPFLRSRHAKRRADSAAPALMADIEADMEQVHSQIAVATRRLEMSVEHMKAKTTSQLAEIGRSSEVIGRLKGEITERAASLTALQDRERAVNGQLQAAVAELGVKTSALTDVEKQLAERKAELAKFLAGFDIHPTLAKAEARHLAEMQDIKAEKALLEEQLRQSREECLKLQYEIETIAKQVESTWASERMANAVLRERINDVATEVVRVAVALEGLGSPVDALIAGRGAAVQLEAARVPPAATDNGRHGLHGSNGQNGELIIDGSDDKATLVHRIRALRKRSNQLPTSG